MSFDSYLPVEVDRFGSLVTAYSRQKLSHGVSPAVRNCRFGMNYVATRYGISTAINVGETANITGLGVLVQVGLPLP
ncbi:MAG: hypothetical protein M3O09_09605, partial [Acidobacteriota bacterium]|nr:hypothetical protein [Acidobacteriota bacterium]